MPVHKYNPRSGKREDSRIPTWDEIRTSGRYDSGETASSVPWYRERSRSSIARVSQTLQRIADSENLGRSCNSSSRSPPSSKRPRLASGICDSTRKESIQINPRLLAEDTSRRYTPSRLTSTRRDSHDHDYFATSSRPSYSNIFDGSRSSYERSQYRTELLRASAASCNGLASSSLYSTSIHRDRSTSSTGRATSVSREGTDSRGDYTSLDAYRTRFPSLNGVASRSAGRSMPRAGTSRRTWEGPEYTWADF